jgi:hypothetical protein
MFPLQRAFPKLWLKHPVDNLACAVASAGELSVRTAKSDGNLGRLRSHSDTSVPHDNLLDRLVLDSEGAHD